MNCLFQLAQLFLEKCLRTTESTLIHPTHDRCLDKITSFWEMYTLRNSRMVEQNSVKKLEKINQPVF